MNEGINKQVQEEEDHDKDQLTNDFAIECGVGIGSARPLSVALQPYRTSPSRSQQPQQVMIRLCWA